MRRYWGRERLFTVIPAVLLACLVLLSLFTVSGEVVTNTTVNTTTNHTVSNTTVSPTPLPTTTEPVSLTNTTVPTTISTTIPATTAVPVLPITTPSLPPTTEPAAVPVLTLYPPEVDHLSVEVNGSAAPGRYGEKISDISWECGDGNKEVHQFPNYHTYSNPGKYEIQVTVHQSDGQSASENLSVIVNEPIPTFLPTTVTPTFPVTAPPPTLPVASQPGPSLSLFVTSVNHTLVTIDGETAPGALNTSITRLHWDWGDGNQMDYLGFPASHNYGLPGTYMVRVTSVQSDGQSMTKHIDVEVIMPYIPIVTESPMIVHGGDTNPDPSILLAAGIIGGLAIAAFGGSVLLKRKRIPSTPLRASRELEMAVENYQIAKEAGDTVGARRNAMECARLLRLQAGVDPTHDMILLEKAEIWETLARTVSDRMTGEIGTNVIDRIEPGDLESRGSVIPPEEINAILEGTDVKTEVLEAVIRVASEISREGREGKPVGTAFIIGDLEGVLARSSQFILNPFKGHMEEERRITDENLYENIKEFAQLDGAFVLSGDGIVEAAGRYVTVDTSGVSIPMGMGSRHASIAGITMVTDSIGVVVSQSGGLIKVFRDGRIVWTLSS
jgi:DNA integrity scanning protein DisA with diadenylate cyclase activity/PKD repeat protein